MLKALSGSESYSEVQKPHFAAGPGSSGVTLADECRETAQDFGQG